ncbi:uncharacterized protein LOC122503964 isoform X2 [Leptopilina heterotoma]|uniref:uncharacterized protein LOC122503964 isoform X2 n=1 Tax=Leptopilina heterotoma TaxID=63436 RepID=UPI001CAA393D|nr:uncharacterized protein LOC122503964 isoform X2 [Leptopilina heterotoma]
MNNSWRILFLIVGCIFPRLILAEGSESSNNTDEDPFYDPSIDPLHMAGDIENNNTRVARGRGGGQMISSRYSNRRKNPQPPSGGGYQPQPSGGGYQPNGANGAGGQRNRHDQHDFRASGTTKKPGKDQRGSNHATEIPPIEINKHKDDIKEEFDKQAEKFLKDINSSKNETKDKKENESSEGERIIRVSKINAPFNIKISVLPAE